MKMMVPKKMLSFSVLVAAWAMMILLMGYVPVVAGSVHDDSIHSSNSASSSSIDGIDMHQNRTSNSATTTTAAAVNTTTNPHTTRSTVSGKVASCFGRALNKMPELKNFLRLGEAQSYYNVEVEYVPGTRATLTIDYYHSATSQSQTKEVIDLSRFATRDELHALFQTKGFLKKTEEEIRLVQQDLYLTEQEELQSKQLEAVEMTVRAMHRRYKGTSAFWYHDFKTELLAIEEQIATHRHEVELDEQLNTTEKRFALLDLTVLEAGQKQKLVRATNMKYNPRPRSNFEL